MANCPNCQHDINLHNTLGYCSTAFCKCRSTNSLKAAISGEVLCDGCYHPVKDHTINGCAYCNCMKYSPPQVSEIKEEKVSIQKSNEVTHQDMEPNSVKIYTKDDQVNFSIQCKHFDLDMCIEQTVEGYNKLAKALGKKVIHLNQIIGAKVEEEHMSFKEKFKIDDDFEEKIMGIRIKDKNPKAFHSRLRKYRLEKSIKMVELCEKLNFDPNQYAEIERGSLSCMLISEDQLLEISSILNLDDSRYNKLKSAHSAS